MAGLVDDDELFRGEVGMWNATGIANNVERRMGWRNGETTVRFDPALTRRLKGPELPTRSALWEKPSKPSAWRGCVQFEARNTRS